MKEVKWGAKGGCILAITSSSVSAPWLMSTVMLTTIVAPSTRDSCSSSAHSGEKHTSASCGYWESQLRSCGGNDDSRETRGRELELTEAAHRPSIHHALLDLDDGRRAFASVAGGHRAVARGGHEASRGGDARGGKRSREKRGRGKRRDTEGRRNMKQE